MSLTTVSTAQTLLLGAIAGLTIFIGLPMGRMRGLSPRLKAFFTATATGILLFLFWDVLSEAIDPVDSAVHEHTWGRFAGVASIALTGFVVGLMSLVYYDTWMKARQRKAMLGPGAASVAEFSRTHKPGLSAAQWLSVFIATGIGLHNFSEGLAIGQSAAQDLKSLALVLVIGFGLHNATEGFGIVGPLSGEAELPSWRFLGLMGLIAGAPTFIGTVIGHAWTSALRRDRAAERVQDVQLQVADRLGHRARAHAWVRNRLHSRRGRRVTGERFGGTLARVWSGQVTRTRRRSAPKAGASPARSRGGSRRSATAGKTRSVRGPGPRPCPATGSRAMSGDLVPGHVSGPGRE